MQFEDMQIFEAIVSWALAIVLLLVSFGTIPFSHDPEKAQKSRQKWGWLFRLVGVVLVCLGFLQLFGLV